MRGSKRLISAHNDSVSHDHSKGQPRDNADDDEPSSSQQLVPGRVPYTIRLLPDPFVCDPSISYDS
eukprot:scaffold2499_cov109-Amphora_coffeaeformis.AAC.1